MEVGAGLSLCWPAYPRYGRSLERAWTRETVGEIAADKHCGYCKSTYITRLRQNSAALGHACTVRRAQYDVHSYNVHST